MCLCCRQVYLWLKKINLTTLFQSHTQHKVLTVWSTFTTTTVRHRRSQSLRSRKKTYAFPIHLWRKTNTSNWQIIKQNRKFIGLWCNTLWRGWNIIWSGWENMREKYAFHYGIFLTKNSTNRKTKIQWKCNTMESISSWCGKVSAAVICNNMDMICSENG